MLAPIGAAEGGAKYKRVIYPGPKGLSLPVLVALLSNHYSTYDKGGMHVQP